MMKRNLISSFHSQFSRWFSSGRKERIVEEYLNNGWSQVPWSTIGSPKSFYKEGSVPKYEAISWVKGHNKIPLLTDSIPVWFDNQVQKYGDKLLFEVVHQNVKFTWNSFNEEVTQLANGLLQIGIGPGDRIGICLGNRYEWVTMFFAACKIGAVAVNINTAYREYEFKHALNLVGCKALLLSEKLKSSHYLEIFDSLIPELKKAPPSPSGGIHSEQIPALRHLILASDKRINGYIRFSDLLISDKNITFPHTTDPNAPINIQFTSGTTGLPKGAVLTSTNILNNGYFVGQGIRLGENDKLVIPVPLYHCFGLVMGILAAMSTGGSFVLPCELFNAEEILSAFKKLDYTPTGLHGVPTMFIQLLNSHSLPPASEFHSLRTGIMAGATCPSHIMRRVISDLNMSEISICYGMTETSPVSFQTYLKDSEENRVGTVGKILPHLEGKVIDDDGNILPIDQIGELAVRGYSVMKGYWKPSVAPVANPSPVPSVNTDAVDADGWISTGDLATFDIDGYCRIVGRKKDMIIRGGENVYPAEVEQFLHSHEAIKDVQVVGVPDSRFGEEIFAFVQLKPNQHLTGKELKEFCKDKISYYKVPKYWEFVDHFPMTVTGKPQKYLLREQAIVILGKKHEQELQHTK